ncbi:MAG: hypothetical protein ACI8S7_002125 [Candidatus Krumholzibacteriia bacterium]|jgi:hypothetical protein
MILRNFVLIAMLMLVSQVTVGVAEEEEAKEGRPAPEVYGVFDGDEMYTLLAPNDIPAIMDPEFVTGKEAADQMSAEEWVMGMADDNDAVCWSTWQLDHHEIVNDEFAGAAIAATW